MKMYWLRHFAALLVVFLATSCSRLQSSVPLSTEVPSSSPSPTYTPEASISKEQVTQLAFVSDRRQRGNLDIWLFDLETEQVEPLTSDNWQDTNPVWSSDGQKLAFRSFEVGGQSVIRMISMMDRTIRNLIPPEYYAPVTDFVWSGDGKSIFYTVFTDLTEDDQVWQLDLQTGEQWYVADAEWLIAVSPDNQYLAFSTREPEYNWLVFRVLRLSDRTELRPTEEQYHLFDQAWSPRDNTLAVVSGLGPEIAIYAVRENGIERQAVDTASGDPEMRLCGLAWSPDGDKLLVVYSSIVSNVCQGELLVYDANLKHHQLLSIEGPVGYARWSPDGGLVAYGRNDTLNVHQYRANVQEQASGEIWVTDLTGLDAHPLISDSAYNGQPAWRP